MVLLIDTYDTEAAARKVVALAPRLRAHGITLHGVRLDSGDLAALALRVREILDAGGLDDTTIFASGGLDEDDLLRLHAHWRAHRRLRPGHEPCHLIGRARPRLRLQARGVRRPSPAQALRRKRRPGQDASRSGEAMAPTAA